jgi:hypothetical protein
MVVPAVGAQQDMVKLQPVYAITAPTLMFVSPQNVLSPFGRDRKLISLVTIKILSRQVIH